MIDLHCHILPAVDDGPADWETSVEMLRLAEDEGIRVMAATPHNGGWRGPEPAHESIPLLVAELERRAREAGLTLQIVPGMEVYIHPQLASIVRAGLALSLNHSRYVLVELPFTTWPSYTDDALFQLQGHGARPILAHVERYAAVQAHPERIVDLVERGVIVQVTAGSLLGSYGEAAQETAGQLLEANLVHLLASDCHNVGSRRPGLAQGHELAVEALGEVRARQLVDDVPSAIVRDQDLELPPPGAIKKRRSFFRFF